MTSDRRTALASFPAHTTRHPAPCLRARRPGRKRAALGLALRCSASVLAWARTLECEPPYADMVGEIDGEENDCEAVPGERVAQMPRRRQSIGAGGERKRIGRRAPVRADISRGDVIVGNVLKASVASHGGEIDGVP